ncbi:MAG: helix-turn-helix transcriptional regulator [Clostridiales bacterium]|nr:helix-turn-helix transcriptional regulator [Clostridiales bacterium]
MSHQDRLLIMYVNHRESLRPLLSHPGLRKYQEFIREIYSEGGAPAAGKQPKQVLAQDTEMPGSLTPRELEVAELAAKGLRNAEIAERLVVTQSTVKKHLQRIFHKLDIDRRSRLIERLGQ